MKQSQNLSKQQLLNAFDDIISGFAILRDAITNANSLKVIDFFTERPARRKFVVSWPSKAARKTIRHSVNGHVNGANVADSVDAIRRIIGASNTPVPIGTLLKELQKQGYIIDTKDPKRTLGARLRDYSKKTGLVFISGHGWWQKERLRPDTANLNKKPR